MSRYGNNKISDFGNRFPDKDLHSPQMFDKRVQIGLCRCLPSKGLPINDMRLIALHSAPENE